MDDQQLIARIQQGDPAAERAMYDAHVDRVWRLVYRIVGDADTAQDCVQEVMLTAWKGIASFREKRPARWVPAAD